MNVRTRGVQAGCNISPPARNASVFLEQLQIAAHFAAVSLWRPSGSPARRLFAFPWAAFRVGLFQIGDRLPEVALGGRQRAVVREILDMAKIGRVLDEVGGASGAPHLGRDGFLDPVRAWLQDDG